MTAPDGRTRVGGTVGKLVIEAATIRDPRTLWASRASASASATA
jgi:hypothetical protein